MRRSPLLPIFLIVLVDVLGLTIVIPLLAIYSETFGASATVASLLMPTFAVCQLVAGIRRDTDCGPFSARRILALHERTRQDHAAGLSSLSTSPPNEIVSRECKR